MGRHKKGESLTKISISVDIEAEIKKEEKNQSISWIFWIKVLCALLVAGSAIGGSVYWVFNKPVIVTHFISLRDEHNTECFDLLTANGNLLDDDDSDDICLWREHQYNITYTLYVWVFMIIAFVVLVLFYFNLMFFGKTFRGHKDHLKEILDDNGERLYYFKLCYEPWIWWTTAAILGRFEVWDLTSTAVFAVIYCLSSAITEEENSRSRTNVSEKTDKRSYIVSRLTDYVSIKSPLITLIIAIYWTTYLFVHYFEIFAEHIHHQDSYVLFTFIWVTCFFLTEFLLKTLYYLRRKIIRKDSNNREEVLKLRYMWECVHWTHQIIYVMGFIWVNAGLLWHTKYIW